MVLPGFGGLRKGLKEFRVLRVRGLRVRPCVLLQSGRSSAWNRRGPAGVRGSKE